MGLTVVRAHTARSLWGACMSAFLPQAGSRIPAAGRRAWIWLSHRLLRDRLFEEACERGMRGWMDPPVTLLAELPDHFGIPGRSAGLLIRRRMVSRCASRLGRRILGPDHFTGGGLVRGHMLDALLADVLPEGVTPRELEKALAGLGGDEFARRRNRWIVEVYRAYLKELEEADLIDRRGGLPRVAEAIERGELRPAIGGGGQLHIYGITGPTSRRRLLKALARQEEVDVRLYLPAEPEPDEFFEGIAEETVVEEGSRASAGVPSGFFGGSIRVQPAPDAAREMAWVARQVKKILAREQAPEPHRVAVVARSGREDTHRVYRALERAGVPATARIRTPLNEVPALKALLSLFRGAARGWDYPSLRAVLEHPYFDTNVDLGAIDFAASVGRIAGLGQWRNALERLRFQVEERAREVRGKGLFADRIGRDLAGLAAVREVLDPLSEPRGESDWIDCTQGLLGGRGVFGMRRHVCEPVEDRWEVVRADQRGIVRLEALLAEWRGLGPARPAGGANKLLNPGEWHSLLGKLLQGSELALTTPGKNGVQVMEAQDAALIPFEYLFLVHANDREFPKAPAHTGVLSDSERQRLTGAGLPVAHLDEVQRRERSLWRAVTQQDGEVWVSYRTTSAGGAPLLPSLMVPAHPERSELPRTRRPHRNSDPVTPSEADQRAAHELHRALRDGQAGAGRVSIAPASQARIRRAIVCGTAEVGRGRGMDLYPSIHGGVTTQGTSLHPAHLPGPWNGEIRDATVLAELARRFGDDYAWSASQLEAYARAPFSFFVERVLSLGEAAEAEEETTALTWGSVAHEILERFYGERLGVFPGDFDESARDRLAQITEAVIAERESGQEWLGTTVLWEQTRSQIGETVAKYVEWEIGHMQKTGERPVAVELEFGFDGPPPAISGTDIGGAPATLRVRGRIDRLDRSGGGKGPHHVLDYKKGFTPSFNAYKDASILQGVIYSQVLANLGYDVQDSRYRAITKPGSPQNGGRVVVGKPLYDGALKLALSIPGRVRAGLFEAVASANKKRWMDWDPPIEIRRTGAVLPDGNRFEQDLLPTAGRGNRAGEAARD